MELLWGHPTPRVRRTAIAVVLAAVVLSGCGAAEKLSPQVAMRDAANSTAKARQGTFTFSLVGTEDDVNAVLNEGAALSDLMEAFINKRRAVIAGHMRPGNGDSLQVIEEPSSTFAMSIREIAWIEDGQYRPS